MEKCLENLDRWMQLLPKDVRYNIPIIYLAIPGSHNSMSYGITGNSKISPEGDALVQFLNQLDPEYTHRWFKDQELNAFQQLMIGIRYFDLRICKTSEGDSPSPYYFCHTLLSNPIEKPFQLIKKFLRNHRKEVIILDFQHFYDFTSRDHRNLQEFINETFGTSLISPKVFQLNQLTIKEANNRRKQILIIYRHPKTCENFWKSEHWPNPWPHATDICQLKHYLEKSAFEQRKFGSGHILQCILTPSFEFVMKNFNKCMSDMADFAIKSMNKWIEKQSPGICRNNASCSRINIVIADFVNINRNIFCKQIIELNAKLLKLKLNECIR